MNSNFSFLLIFIYHVKLVLSNLALDVDLLSTGCFQRWYWQTSCSKMHLPSWIKVNGKNIMTPRRGWNLAVLDHRTGRTEKTSNFPTHLPGGASAKLERFINEIQDKRIVLGVVVQDGFRHLTARGYWALRTVGGRNFFARSITWSLAFIGYKNSLALPKHFCRKVGKPHDGGGARLISTIGKINHGDDMHFALQSTGFLDRGHLGLHQIRSFVSYGKHTTTRHYGLNIMVVDHRSGDLYAMKNFNTHVHKHAAGQMVSFIRKLPRGLIVLGAAHSDWTRHTTSQLNQVLHQLFFTHVPTTFDGSWAMVGYTGGRSALPFNGFPISRMTLSTTKPRHKVIINYFTNILDTNECKNGEATCSKNTVCRNTVGSYDCYCKKGFEKKGSRCVDINECLNGKSICGGRAVCKNTPGSYVCQCKDTKEKLLFGIICREITIKISGPDCYHKKQGNAAVCKKLPIKIEVNGKDTLKKPKRGFKIVVIDSHTGKVESVSVFDTWLHESESSRLHKFLTTIQNHKIVIGAVYDEEHQYVRSNVNGIIKQLSGRDVPKTFDGVYTFIGSKGNSLPHLSNIATSKVYGGPVVLESRFWALPKPPYVAIKIASVGYKKGKSIESYIEIGSTKFTDKQMRSGFNFVVVDSWSGSSEIMRSFSTHKRGLPDINKMKSFLDTLPTDRIVVGVVKGEAFQGIRTNYNALLSIHRLLGVPMRQKSAGGSFAFIGSTFTGSRRKPAYVQQAAASPGRGPATVFQGILFGKRKRNVKVDLRSTGCDDPGSHRTGGCYLANTSIKVDEKETSVKGRGINVVVVSQINGRTLSRKRFDTGTSLADANKMADFIDLLPTTAIVLGSVKDNARGYFFNSTKLIRAMTQLLGKKPQPFAVRGSYAFIGFKGRTKHSWVKQSHKPHRKGGVSLAAVIPLIPDIRLNLVSSACSPAGSVHCSKAENSIKVNGKEYTKSGIGFNLAVINIHDGIVERTAHFDTSQRNFKGSNSMVKFLNGLPTHRIVVGVVKGEGYQGLTEEAKKVMARLIKKTRIVLSARSQSYIFVGFTSKVRYFMTRDAGGLVGRGTKRLNIVIPIMQTGCTFPTAPSGGKVRRVEYDVSEDVDYICRRGFTTVGDPQVCSQNGTFVGKVPKCKAQEFIIYEASSSSGNIIQLSNFPIFIVTFVKVVSIVIEQSALYISF